MDKGRPWMYPQPYGNEYISGKFLNEVEESINFAFFHPDFVRGNRIRCPCLKCHNKQFLEEDDVRNHLYYKGFFIGYMNWNPYGEVKQKQSSRSRDKGWKLKSNKDRKNRLLVKKKGIMKYAVGSTPFRIHAYKMLQELRGPVKDRTHKRSKGHNDFVDKSKCARSQVVGGLETTHAHVFGFCTKPRATNISKTASSCASSPYPACDPKTTVNSHEHASIESEDQDSDGSLSHMENELTAIEQFTDKMIQKHQEIMVILLGMTSLIESGKFRAPHLKIGSSQPEGNTGHPDRAE